MSPIQVQGFPTLAKFRPHQQVDYYEGGERTKKISLLGYMEKKKEKKGCLLI